MSIKVVHVRGDDSYDLVLLCDRDHGIPHRAGWDLFITSDGWCWFRSPVGRTFWGQRHGHQRTGPTPDHDGDVEAEPREAAVATPPAADRATSHRLIEGRAPPVTSATMTT